MGPVAITFIFSQQSLPSIVCYPGNFTALEDPDFKVKEVDLGHGSLGAPRQLSISITRFLFFFLSHLFTAGCRSEFCIYT